MTVLFRTLGAALCLFFVSVNLVDPDLSIAQQRLSASASPSPSATPSEAPDLSRSVLGPTVAIIDLDMMILPGTKSYLEGAITEAAADGAKVLVVNLDTPGGILGTTQEMIQAIFKSPIPVIIYISPSGSTATSAGVFITVAGHIAAMAPGTSIGAAHPVAGNGQDIEGDMRAKVENMATAMIVSISEQRGRNVEWVEKAVRSSVSITEKEALKEKVVDVVAGDLTDLLKQIAGKEVTVQNDKITLGDYSNLPRKHYDMKFRDKAVNVLANPDIAALLWLGATTGLSLELYNPGAIVPGVVGIICLILALAVSQIIPISTSGVLLIVAGALLIGADLYVNSIVLGIGGVVAMALGALSLVDVTKAPGMAVSIELILPVAIVVGGFMLYTIKVVYTALRGPEKTGGGGMVGKRGYAVDNIAEKGKVDLNGEYWNAVPCSTEAGIIEKGAEVEVVRQRSGLILEVRKVEAAPAPDSSED